MTADQSPDLVTALPDVEVVAAKVHEAWMDAKRRQGVESRPSEWGEEQMVPYEDLSERAKSLDRSTVEAVYAAIRSTDAHPTPAQACGKSNPNSYKKCRLAAGHDGFCDLTPAETVDGDWIVHTHIGTERKGTHEEAERRADFLRTFFRNRPDTDIWIEPAPAQTTPSTPTPAQSSEQEVVALREALATDIATTRVEVTGDALLYSAADGTMKLDGEPFDDDTYAIADHLIAKGWTRLAALPTALTSDEWDSGDRRDVAAWLIREADQRVKFFPQRRDGVDALIRHLAAAVATLPTEGSE